MERAADRASDQAATRGVGFPGFDGYQWRSASRGQSPASASSSYEGRDGREREAERLRDRRSPGSAASGRWACGCPLAARCAWPSRATTRCRRCTTVTTSRVSRNASKHSNPLESPTPSHIAATTKPPRTARDQIWPVSGRSASRTMFLVVCRPPLEAFRVRGGLHCSGRLRWREEQAGRERSP